MNEGQQVKLVIWVLISHQIQEDTHVFPPLGICPNQNWNKH